MTKEFIIKSGFKSRAGYNGACTVHIYPLSSVICILGIESLLPFGAWLFPRAEFFFLRFKGPAA